MSNATACAAAPATSTAPCSRCDLLLGLEGAVHVEAVERDPGRLTVTVSTLPRVMGCPSCGVIAAARGRRRRVLHDVPQGDVRVWLVWRQRSWRCREPTCPQGTFTEQVPDLVAERGSITTRAVAWAIGQLRREHATIAGLARQLAVAWKTVWRAVLPELERLDADRPGSTGSPPLAWTSTCGITVTRAARAPKS